MIESWSKIEIWSFYILVPSCLRPLKPLKCDTPQCVLTAYKWQMHTCSVCGLSWQCYIEFISHIIVNLHTACIDNSLDDNWSTVLESLEVKSHYTEASNPCCFSWKRCSGKQITSQAFVLSSDIFGLTSFGSTRLSKHEAATMARCREPQQKTTENLQCETPWLKWCFPTVAKIC